MRRILRRAARFGRSLGMHEPFIFTVVDSVARSMGDQYPELRERQTHIERVIRGEEEGFNATLDRGLEIFESVIGRIGNSTSFPGEEAFRLYDTYGFPLDLIAEACKEHGMTLDEAGFQLALEEQRDRARKTAGFEAAKAKPVVAELAGRIKPTVFVGYEGLKAEGTIQAILKGDHLVKEAVEGDAIELA